MTNSNTMGWKIERVFTPDTPLRRARLDLVEAFVCGRLHLGAAELASRVDSITDYKGNLRIDWRIVPVAAERDAWTDAWNYAGGERPTVRHGLTPGPYDDAMPDERPDEADEIFDDPQEWGTDWLACRTGEGREARLLDLKRDVLAALQYSESQLASRLFSAEDHKGDLYLTWRFPPQEFEKKAFYEAWERQNESGENVRHSIASNPFGQ